MQHDYDFLNLSILLMSDGFRKDIHNNHSPNDHGNSQDSRKIQTLTEQEKTNQSR